MLYFLIAAIMLVFSIMLDKFRNNNLKILVYIILIFILVSFTGLRGDIDPDYSNYIDIFNGARNNINLGVEPAFFYFNKIIACLNLDFQWVIFLIALFSITLKINFFLNNSKNFAFSILIYYCSMFFLYDFIAIRQALAMAFFMTSLPYLMERKFIPYCFFIIFASLFHLSALVLLPLYFFIYYSCRKIFLYFILSLATLVSVLKIDIQLVSLVLGYLSLPGFALNKLDIYVQEDVFAALSFRQLLLGFIFVLFSSRQDDKIIKIFLNIYILGIIVGTLFNEIPQLSFRLKAYFLWTESILVVYYICKTFKNNDLLRFFVYLILAGLYMLSLYSYLGALSERQGNYIYPYKVFFE
ncbi:EpsG family protein [Acinetobacter corruptisaponis]|uniref:EpsG family protein n=1 Tax=Acinetobacter corruptisaponis TaxID=3045147 RepID=A0ABY8RZF2_9GAMM|nr:EpsG family protein [Acinetobacter sp. KCTC 92772]WHP04495.1 EpsG family protein [Acinetobacter sp. KCTC 92772]